MPRFLDAPAARGDQAVELQEMKESYEAALQLVHMELEELKEAKRKAEVKVQQIMAVCMAE